MDIKTKSDEVMKARGWTQRRLAEEIGINETTLTNARNGRRPLPTQALIRLERLRGADDHSIIEQLLKTAACVALAIVLIFWTGEKNTAMASSPYAEKGQVMHIITLLHDWPPVSEPGTKLFILRTNTSTLLSLRFV